MKQNIVLLFAFLVIPMNTLAQDTGAITGKVIDARSKEPLVGANVIVLDTNRGASTDMKGGFIIEKVPVGTYRMRFVYIGYEPVLKSDIVVISANPVHVNAQLTESTIEGETITVTAGYFVEEEKVQPSTIGLSREEIRRFPGGFEDVVRTVSTLPGVAINATGGRNDLLVRGGGPSENLYLINNIEVPNINHFGSQGNSSGSLSFVNLDFVQEVTFSTGGFGAQYGDKMSSVLSLSMADNVPRGFESKWTVSATQYGFDFEKPFSDRGNLIFSARKSYLDLIFKAAGLPFVPVYTDFNIVMNYDLSPKDELFFLGLSAINNIDRDQSSLQNRTRNAGLLDNSQYQGITGLNYRRLLNHGYLDITLGSHLFRYRLSQIDETEEEYFKSDADEWENSMKVQHYWVASKSIGVRSGVSAKFIRNNNTTAFADTIYDRSGNRVPVAYLGLERSIETDQNAQKYAAFTELDWLIHPRLDVNTMSIEGYYKKYRELPSGIVPGVTDYVVLNNTGIGFGGREDDFQSFGYYDLTSTATGQSYGAELLIQKRFSEIPLYGLMSLTSSKSAVTANNGMTYPGQYDQRFIFNLTGGYIFNSKWEMSGKFRYFTGVPFSTVYRPTENPSNPGYIQNLPDEYLADRTPAGHHLDIRVDRYFNFRNWTLVVYLDIQNIYDYKIPQRPVYDFWEDEIYTSSEIGILPSIGISLEL